MPKVKIKEEVVVKKKKKETASVEKPEVKKRKKAVLEVETVEVKPKRKKKEVLEVETVKPKTKTKAKSAEVDEKIPKKKKSKLPIISEALSATQLVIELAERSDVDNKTAKTILTELQGIIVESLRKGGVGTVKALGWNFKSALKPAVKGGEKRPNPFRKGEFMITKPKPAMMKIKALALKPFKNQLEGI